MAEIDADLMTVSHEEVIVQRAIKTVDRHAKDDAEFHVVLAMLGLSEFEGATARP
jgi:hypothetical protein